MHECRCHLARQKVEGKKGAVPCYPLGGTSSEKCPVGFEACRPGPGKRVQNQWVPSLEGGKIRTPWGVCYPGGAVAHGTRGYLFEWRTERTGQR